MASHRARLDQLQAERAELKAHLARLRSRQREQPRPGTGHLAPGCRVRHRPQPGLVDRDGLHHLHQGFQRPSSGQTPRQGPAWRPLDSSRQECRHGRLGGTVHQRLSLSLDHGLGTVSHPEEAEAQRLDRLQGRWAAVYLTRLVQLLQRSPDD